MHLAFIYLLKFYIFAEKMGKRDGNKMRDWHRVFLQKVMSQGYMSGTGWIIKRGERAYLFIRKLVLCLSGVLQFLPSCIGRREEESEG